MEMSNPMIPNNNNGNANANNFGDNNVNHPNSSSDNNPSPTATAPHIPFLFWNSDSPSPSATAGAGVGASSECTGLYKRRAISDGDLRLGAANADVGLSGKPSNGFLAPGHQEMGAEEDLVSAFLDLQNLGENYIGGGGGGLMNHDGDDGGKLEKSSSSSSSFRVPEPKKAIPKEKLDEIRAVDPKRVKRILANRQSAARSKERKARYLLELERRFQSLQSEATNLLAQLRIYQRDATSLSKENADLKIQLQALKQQADLHDTLNEALKQEVERLKIATGEIKAPSEPFSLQGARLLSYSPLASPSNMQPTQYSPLTSPSTMQTVCYSPVAASLSPRTTPNLFPIPKQPVPVLAQLPPLHNPRSSLCFRPPNPQTPPPQQNLNHSTGGLQGFDNSKRGLNLDSPVSGGESSATTQLRTP